MHFFLGLAWDEWGSIVAIVSGICFLANWILNKTVKTPLNQVGNKINRFNDESMRFRQQNAAQINNLENRVFKVEGRLDGYDLELKHLYEKEVDRHEKD